MSLEARQASQSRPQNMPDEGEGNLQRLRLGFEGAVILCNLVGSLIPPLTPALAFSTRRFLPWGFFLIWSKVQEVVVES